MLLYVNYCIYYSALQLYRLQSLNISLADINNKQQMLTNHNNVEDTSAFNQVIRQYSMANASSSSMLKVMISTLYHLYKHQYDVLKHFPFQLQKSNLSVDVADHVLDTVYVQSNAVLPTSNDKLNGIALDNNSLSVIQYVRMKCPSKNTMLNEACLLSCAIISINTGNQLMSNILVSNRYVVDYKEIVNDLVPEESSGNGSVLTLGSFKIWQEVSVQLELFCFVMFIHFCL